MAADGLMLVCQPEGAIKEVIRAVAGTDWRPGDAFADHLDPGSRAKFARLLAQVQDTGSLAGWEVVTDARAGYRTLLLSALRYDADVLIVGTAADPHAAPLLDAMASLNSEQANARRSTEQELRREREASAAFSTGLLEELATINNELTTLQRTLAQKNAALQQLNAQMTRFLGMAAHDLRNPLNVIGNYAEILLEDVTDPDQAHCLRAIQRSSGYMRSLVDDLLDTSQLESGRIALAPQPLDLGAFAADLLGRMRPFADAKRIRLTMPAQAGPGRVLADAVRLEQVLTNLLTNALKFSAPDTEVSIGWDQAPGQLAIAVTDQGPGIPEAELRQLFEPFAKGSARPTGGEQSTGLGLWIARRVVEAHDGRLVATSELGRGTTFTVWLPEA